MKESPAIFQTTWGSAIISLLVAIAFAFAVITHYGCYYEEYQSLFHSFLSGAFSPGTPFNSWYYQGYIGLSHIYSFIYQSIPGIEWLSWLSYTYITLSAATIIFLIHLQLKNHTPAYISIPFLFIISYLLFTTQFISLQNARVSYLLCGSSLLALIVLFNNTEKIKQHLSLFIALNLMFLLGALTRSEPALGTVLLMLSFALVWHKNIKQAIITAGPALLITLALIIAIIIDLKTSTQFHKQVEPDIEMQLTVRGNVVPLSQMTTARDSMRYEAALEMLWGDPDIVSVQFLRSLIKLPPYTSWSTEQLKRTITELAGYSGRHITLLLFNLLLTIILCGNLLQRKLFFNAALSVFFLLAFCIAVIAQTYMVKMRDWSFSPYLSLFTAANILLLLKYAHLSKIRQKVVVIILVLAMLAQHLQVQNTALQLKSKQSYNEKLYAETIKIARDETLLINPTSYQNFISAHQPFTPFNYNEFQKLFFFESQIASLLPGYRDYFEKECKCSVWNFSNFYRYLLSPNYPHQVYALSTAKRMDLIARYLKVIHGFNLQYHEVQNFKAPSPPAFGNKQHLYLLVKQNQTVSNNEIIK